MARITREVSAITDRQINLGGSDSAGRSGAHPVAATASDHETPVVVRVEIGGKTGGAMRTDIVRWRAGD